jgi:hypothetical protein
MSRNQTALPLPQNFHSSVSNSQKQIVNSTSDGNDSIRSQFNSSKYFKAPYYLGEDNLGNEKIVHKNIG